MALKCPECGEPTYPDERQCPTCGTALAAPALDIRLQARPPQRKSNTALIISLAVGIPLLVICVGVVVVVIIVHNKLNPEWKTFTDPDKRFSVLMPGTPVLKEQ